MYQSFGSQLFRTINEIQSRPGALEITRSVMTFLFNVEFIAILCSLRLVLEEKASKEMYESSRFSKFTFVTRNYEHFPQSNQSKVYER